MTSSRFPEVQTIAADVLQVPADEIGLHSSVENVDTWDSLHHLSLVLALEQAFDVRFEPEEMEQATSIDAILVACERKQGL